MKIRTIIISVFCFIGVCNAQQEPQFTMYWNNYSLFNPAATGVFNKHFAAVSGRQQWRGLSGAPQTISAVYDYHWAKIHSGIGINYFNNQQGLETNNKLNINYSYHFQMKNSKILSLGLAVGVLQKTIDYSSLVFPGQTPDPLFPTTKAIDNLININLGAMYKTPRFLLGIGATQLPEPESEKLHFKAERHFFLNSSYRISVGKHFDLTPGIYSKSDLTATQLDMNLLASYKKTFWIGLTYRLSDALAFIAGVDIKEKFRIGYSYDYTTSALSRHSSGSHEVVLAMMLSGKQ